MLWTRLISATAIAVAATTTAAAAQDADLDDIYVRGWLEHARLMPVNLLLDAKLDPGARTSSIRAEILRGPEPMEEPDADDDEVDETDAAEEEEEEEADEQPADESQIEDDEEVVEASVRRRGPRESIVFRIANESGRSRTLEREVIRYVEIKMRGGGTSRRPVVMLGFCVAGVWMEGEVNLSPREGFNYPLLIGRNMLADAQVLVDSRETYTERSHCDPPDGYGEDDD